jgi:hypothetical protein
MSTVLAFQPKIDISIMRNFAFLGLHSSYFIDQDGWTFSKAVDIGFEL